MSSAKNSTIKKTSAKPKAKEKYVLGIDIGSLYIRASVTAGPMLKDTYQVESAGVVFGVISDQELFEEALGRLLLEINRDYKPFPPIVIVTSGAVSINSITATSSVFTSRADGVITTLDVKKATEEAEDKVAELKNKTILHAIPIRNTVDGLEIIGDVIGAKGHKLDVRTLFVYDDPKQINAIIEAFRKYSIDIDEIVAGPLADSIASLSNRERRIGVASANIGYATTSVCVYENNSPILASVFKSGGEHITSDIALGMRLDLVSAEKIKYDEPGMDFSRRRVDEIIEARVHDISDKINNELARIKRAELLPAGIVLSGGTALLSKIDYYLRYNLKLPISSGLKNLRDTKNFYVDDPRFARSYGATFFAKNLSESSLYITFFKFIGTHLTSFFRRFLP